MSPNNQTSPITDKVSIRTMQDDLAGRRPAPAGLPSSLSKPPDQLPVSPGLETPIPSFSPKAPKPVEPIAPLPPKQQPEPQKTFAQTVPLPPKPSSTSLPTPPLPPKRPSESDQTTIAAIKKKISPRFWLYMALGVSCLALVATLGFLFYKKEPGTEPPIVGPPADQLTPTPTLIPEVEITFIRLTDKSKIELKEKISEITQKITQGTQTSRLVATIVEEGVEKTLTLSEISEILGLEIPESLKNTAEETYNLVLICAPTEVPSEPEKREERLALVFETTQPDQAKDSLKEWEATMAKDLEGLMLEPPGQEATAEFQETVYKGAALRYKNLPHSSLTVDYTVSQDIIIITTSKQSIYTIYELVLNQPLGS